MKNIFSLALITTAFIMFSCEVDENPVDATDTYFSISAPGGTSIDVQASTAVDIDIDIRSSGGVTSLTANGNAVTLGSGNIQTATYTFNVPGTDTLGTEYTIDFVGAGSGLTADLSVTATLVE